MPSNFNALVCSVQWTASVLKFMRKTAVPFRTVRKGSKNVPKNFQLCFVDVVSKGRLLCESAYLLVGVSACCGLQDLSVGV